MRLFVNKTWILRQDWEPVQVRLDGFEIEEGR
jgi:hypothetical protein